MVTGEKKEEFRKFSEWIQGRLFDTKTWREKQYDVIRFVNGYGKDKPFFVCKFDGFIQTYMKCSPRKYSNGLIVDNIDPYDFIIYCGEIIKKGNL